MKTVEKQGNMIKMIARCVCQLCVFALLFGLLMVFSGCEKSEEEIDEESVITYEFVTESLPEKAISLIKEEEEKLRIKREKEEKEKAELEAEEAQKYHFIDVCQEDYEMVIDEDAKVNPYNNDCFTYTTTDAKGKELVFDKPMILTETGIPLGYRGVISYEDEKYTSRFGVDVSRHLGNINWAKAKEAGVEFAIVRIGFRGYGKSGQINKDVKALDNIKGAKDAGIDVGVYFFSQAINEEEAIEEAEFVLNELNGIELEMPIVFDPEHILHDDARTDDIPREQFTKNSIAFCERVKEAGYEPMIYANMKWEAYDLEMGTLKEYPFWYADYEKLPQSPYDFEMWQYTEAGSLDGFDGRVDLNVQFLPKE